MIEERIREAIRDSLKKLGIEGVEPVLEHPGDLSHGDYSTNVALAAAKKAGANPKELAQKIVDKLGVVGGVSEIDTAGPGFINFHLSREFFAESVEGATENKKWGWGDALKGKQIMIDHTQPNPFKPFHIGHLMSNAIGEALSRIFSANGAEVIRVNYQGDIGLHVAKCMWAVLKDSVDVTDIAALGNAYVIGSTAYEEDSLAKNEINDLNRRLYEKDPELMPLYTKGRETSLKHFEDLYKVLGSTFDRLYMESETVDLAKEAIAEALKKGILEISDGATIFKGEAVGLNTRVFVNSLGIPTYEGKELGLIQLKRKEYPFDIAYTSTAVEQENFFKVVTKAAEMLWPDFVGKYKHIAFGMMQLSGGKMSSRKGNIITGEALIEDMRAEAIAKMEGRDLGDEKQAIADAVAVAAIKYSILKQATGKNIVFDPEQSLSFEGDSGPYLQYAHVRARAVLRKAGGQNKEWSIENRGTIPEEVTELERLLYRFPSIVARAQKENEPHHVTTFLTQLAGAFNSWYAQGKIVDSTDAASPYKVALTEAFATTMKNGLWLLGIQAPERM